MPSPTTTATRHYLQPLLDEPIIDAYPEFSAVLGGLSKAATNRAVRRLIDAGQLQPILPPSRGHKTRLASADVLRLLGLSRADAAEIVREHQAAQAGHTDALDGTADGSK